MAFHEALSNSIQAHFKTNVEDGLSIATLHDNEEDQTDTDKQGFKKPSDGSLWVRLSILEGESLQASLGAGPTRERTNGVMIASIFGPHGKGAKNQLTLADQIKSFFRRQTIGQAVFRVPSVSRVGRREQWYQVNVTCPFWADDLV